MSRFGWAYVNDVITGSGGTPGGSDKAIQFASGSSFSGSTNFTFDYNTNTVRLTGTLYADTLIVSSSTIYKSGSTKFGDDSGDTHQFTGSLYNTTLISGTIAQFTTISGSVVSASTYYGLPTTSTIPGGSNTSIQFNSGSTFSGSSNLTYNYTTNNVSLTGALLMSGTSYISEVDYIDFDIAASTPSWKNGRVYWNNTDGCLDVYNAEADITLQVGQENWTRVYNDSGVVLTNGTAVTVNGTHGDVPNAVKAQSLLVSGSVNLINQIIGLATHDIEVGSFGYITTQGLVRGLNTNAFNDGDTLYVSSSAGLLTSVPPEAPYEIIPVGVCVKASPGTSGIIYVAVQQPLDFSDLSSVYVSGTYTYGDIWTYVTSSNRGYWTHTNTLSGSYIITGSLTATNTITATSASFLDYVQLGTSLSDEVYFNASSKTNIQPATTNTVDLGGSSRYWNTGYITTLSSSAISSSVSVKTGEITATSIVLNGNLSSSGNINGSGLQIAGSGQFGGTVTVTGSVSASANLQTAGDITAGTNLTVNNFATIKNGLIVTGSSTVSGALTVLGTMSSSFINGNGNGITGINGANVNGVGDDWTIQIKDGNTGTLTGSSNLTFTGSILYVTGTVNATSFIGNGSGLTNIASPKYAIFYANGVTTGSNYEIVTLNANKYLQLKRRKNFPTARSIGLTNSEYGWTWLNRSNLHQLSASTENISSSNSANFIHNTSSNTTWFGGTATAPVRYRNYNLQVGQTLQVTTKISAYSVSNYDQTQAIVWLSGSVDKYVRFGVGYDNGTNATAQSNIGSTTNHTLTSGQAAAGIWWTANVTPSHYSIYYNLSTGSVTPPTSGWIFSQGNTFVNASATTVGNVISVGQMIMTGKADTSITSTGSFQYFDIQVKPHEEDGYFVPNSYYRWGAAQYDTSATEQLIGEFDLGSTSATVDQTKLRLALADLVNNLSGDSATVTWSAVQSSSSGASSSTYYDAASVVVSGTGRYFRLWMKVASSADTGGSIGPFPITIPIS
jgi:hypothetical protein